MLAVLNEKSKSRKKEKDKRQKMKKQEKELHPPTKADMQYKITFQKDDIKWWYAKRTYKL